MKDEEFRRACGTILKFVGKADTLIVHLSSFIIHLNKKGHLK